MTQEGMLAVSLWIVSFILLLIVVLMNLVLAMIFDHYGEVRSTVLKEDTIFEFFGRMIMQLKLQSSWVSNTTLLVKISQLPAEELVTQHTVRRMLPGIQKEQVQHLFDTASKKQMMRMAMQQGDGSLAKFIAGFLVSLSDTRRAVKTMSTGLSPEKVASGEVPSRNRRSRDGDKDAADMSLAGPGGEAPEAVPDFMKAGILQHLKSQRQAMREMNVAMDEIKDSMSKRGLVCRPPPWRETAPPEPNMSFLKGDWDVTPQSAQGKQPLWSTTCAEDNLDYFTI
jgi:hypothetical protein